MSLLNVDKIDPNSGTALEIGTSGDTVTVPSGVGLTLTDSTLLLPTTIQTDKLDPKSGTALEIGTSGDTITVPSGATFNVAGTLQSGGSALVTGKVLQVVQGLDTSERSTTSTSYVSMTLNASITPSATDSKVLVIVQAAFGLETAGVAYFDIARDIGGGGYVSQGGGQGFGQINTADTTGGPGGLVTLNSPSTTSAVTYRVDAKVGDAADTCYVGRGGVSTIVLMEIGA